MIEDANVLVGTSTADDAAAYRIDDQRAVIQTVDFITPIVDDPYDYGAIAAANSLSDVYAMGGQPAVALAVCGFPDDVVPREVDFFLRKTAIVDDFTTAGGPLDLGSGEVPEPAFWSSLTNRSQGSSSPNNCCSSSFEDSRWARVG